MILIQKVTEGFLFVTLMVYIRCWVWYNETNTTAYPYSPVHPNAYPNRGFYCIKFVVIEGLQPHFQQKMRRGETYF